MDDIDYQITQRFEIIEAEQTKQDQVLWKAIDLKETKLVLIKKLFKSFLHHSDFYAAIREISILQELQNIPNILKLQEVIKSENERDIYLVFEYQNITLEDVTHILTSEQIKFIFYQMMCAIHQIHSAMIIHRNLTLSNIFIDKECNIKIYDFSNARSMVYNVEENGLPQFKCYIQALHYRPPEILMGQHKYNKASDMWYAGCILAYLIYRQHLFQGNSAIDQLQKIIDVIGKPTNEELSAIDTPLAQNLLKTLKTNKKKNQIHEIFKQENDELKNLLKGLLNYNPLKRFTALQVLTNTFFYNHPYAHLDLKQVPNVVELINHNQLDELDTQARVRLLDKLVNKRKVKKGGTIVDYQKQESRLFIGLSRDNEDLQIINLMGVQRQDSLKRKDNLGLMSPQISVQSQLSLSSSPITGKSPGNKLVSALKKSKYSKTLNKINE